MDGSQHDAFEPVLECAHKLHATKLVYELIPAHTFILWVIHEPPTTIYIHTDEHIVERQRSHNATRTTPSGVSTRFYYERDFHARYRKRTASKKKVRKEPASTGRDTQRQGRKERTRPTFENERRQG